MELKERLIILNEPNSAIAESYRSLRAVLSRSLAKGKNKFTIVSAWGGEGKSMVSANLAVAFSQLLMDVVLIDGDLRRPTLSRVFEREEKRGLLQLLEFGGSVKDCIYPTQLERLSVLPAGRSSSNPGDLLGKGNFGEILNDPSLRDVCVVLDTSPLSACSDALLMGPQTDGAIMIVSPDRWHGEEEAHFAQDLEDHGIDILGAVLNKADEGEQAPGSGYGYGYGQGYGQEHHQDNHQKKESKGLLRSLFNRKNKT